MSTPSPAAWRPAARTKGGRCRGGAARTGRDAEAALADPAILRERCAASRSREQRKRLRNDASCARRSERERKNDHGAGRQSFAPFASVAAPTVHFRQSLPGAAGSPWAGLVSGIDGLDLLCGGGAVGFACPTAAVVSYFSPALRSMRPLLLQRKKTTVRACSKSKDSREATFNKARDYPIDP